ncbi:hypothetical protein GCM10009557_68230 [Virgisporangium ochraceum]|uniref:Uncharacterized protein n=1 Tax=Virgisporangium ochraceum TaxID=65505 RepID=A0A8J3ZRW5_9ACTN|nr:hypothetical protein [Virgisporangium ochraceum]GIJ68611.1 hypothetical protein Voc01_035280 [Virgisporangium ochraceum]
MSEAPAVYHPSPFPSAEHHGARHRAGGWSGMSAVVWIVLGVAIVALAAVGVLFAL